MFNNLKNRFTEIFNNIGKKPSITEDDLKSILREIRLVLLEADVSIDVTKIIVEKLNDDLLNKEISRSLNPKTVITKALYDVLFNILQDENPKELITKPISYYMMVGLQGSGKTTSTGKIAHYLKNKLTKNVLVCSIDLHRPAAYEQLKHLSNMHNIDFFEYEEKNISTILQNLKDYANEHKYDVVIIDTAGRLSIDNELMEELVVVNNFIKPVETFLVIDSASGQIALDVANHFKEKINLTGIIPSKTDSDSRGGAIISCKFVTKSNIRFMGVGEKINDLEVFNGKKIVDRILNQGDLLTLVEKFDEIQDKELEDMQKNLEKGLFTLGDFKKQLLQMNKLGGLTAVASMIPGLSEKISGATLKENILKKHIAIIDSMTHKERKNPKLLNFSRKKRIASGSGTQLSDINVLLKQYDQMSSMFKKFKQGGGMFNMFKQLKNLTSLDGANMENYLNKLK